MLFATDLCSAFWFGWSALLCTRNAAFDHAICFGQWTFPGMTSRGFTCALAVQLARLYSGSPPWAAYVRGAASQRRKRKEIQQTPTQPHTPEPRPSWRKPPTNLWLREIHPCSLWVWEQFVTEQVCSKSYPIQWVSMGMTLPPRKWSENNEYLPQECLSISFILDL